MLQLILLTLIAELLNKLVKGTGGMEHCRVTARSPFCSNCRQGSYHPLCLLTPVPPYSAVHLMSMFPAPVGTSEENELIKSGTVNSIHKDVKQRFFPHMSEVLRIRIDVRRLVGQIRGEQYARLQTMRGEDLPYVVVRSCLHLYSVRVLSIFETLTSYLKAKFAIDVCAAELSVELPRRAPVSVSYTLLDVLFICILNCNDSTFPCQFVDEGRILSLPLILVERSLSFILKTYLRG